MHLVFARTKMLPSCLSHSVQCLRTRTLHAFPPQLLRRRSMQPPTICCGCGKSALPGRLMCRHESTRRPLAANLIGDVARLAETAHSKFEIAKAMCCARRRESTRCKIVISANRQYAADRAAQAAHEREALAIAAGFRVVFLLYAYCRCLHHAIQICCASRSACLSLIEAHSHVQITVAGST